MMRAVIQKTILQRLVKQCQIVSDEDLLVEYHDDGWRILMNDPANVALIKIDIGKDVMDSYELDFEANQRQTCLALDKLGDALNTIADEGAVSLHDDGTVLHVDCGKIHRRIRKVGVFRTPKYPALSLRCTLSLDTNEVSRVLSNGLSISDHFSIECGPDGLRITVDGVTDTSFYENTEITPDCDNPEDRNETYRSSFPLDYFIKALKAINGEVLIEMDTDMPLRMMCLKPFTTVYLVAPRIEQDQE